METVAEHTARVAAAKASREPMTNLTRDAIMEILAGAKAKKARTSKNSYIVRLSDGTSERRPGKPPTGVTGRFHGKVGTPTRNRKGRTSRKPNGYATYIIPWWEAELVVAYTAERVVK